MSKNVREAMTRMPRSATLSLTAVEAARMMQSEDVGSLPVVDGEQLVGIVTDRDIAMRVVAGGKDPDSTTVSEIFSPDPVTVLSDQDLDEALELMALHQVRRLPVVEDGDRLVGILTQADVAHEAKEKKVGELIEEISQPAPSAETFE
jgi:CBS domain-containing protein